MAKFTGKNTDDIWTGTTGKDSAKGRGGNDQLSGGDGADTLNGGPGDDRLSGDAGVDKLDGGDGNDTIYGGAGDDIMKGGAGNDYLSDTIGDGTQAQLFGGDGNDTLLACFGQDYFDGGAGIDTLRFVSNLAGGIDVDLGNNRINDDGYGFQETLLSVENVGSASQYADVIIGSKGANTLVAGEYDTVSGAAGDDLIRLANAIGTKLDGGSGRDMLEFTGYADVIRNGFYTTLYADRGVSVDLTKGRIIEDGFGAGAKITGFEDLTGGFFGDSFSGNGLANRLFGLSGDDTLSGRAGNDTLDGGVGNDRLIGGGGRDVLTGGWGADTFVFKSLAEFGGKTSKAADLITDFSHADGDRIDLSAIDAKPGGKNNAFKFIGSEAFHGTPAELRYEIVDGHTYVSGDTNGDGKADFMIHLTGEIVLTKDDFLL